MVSVVIHSNPGLANQRESSCWLSEGLARHGVTNVITADKHAEADVHIIQGPWYAYREWIGKPNVLFLNRCFWGDARLDISIGWLNPDGTRDFRNQDKTEPNGELPEMKPLKQRKRCAVVFGDYGEDCTELLKKTRSRFDSVFFRPHPAQKKTDSPVMTLGGDLTGVWELADVAIGGSSTVLCEAVFEGLAVETTDPRNVVSDCGEDRQAWATRLSWANWNRNELRNGEFWEHLNVAA